jgi:membrane protein DedA with SNARE-associated domain
MSLLAAIVAATAGNVVGSLLAYALGATGLLERVPGGRRALGRSQQLLSDRPLRAVFIARLLPLARTFVSLPAGARRVPIIGFTAVTTAGCAIWAAAFVLAGLLAGTAWTTVGSVAGKLGLGAAVAVAAVLVWRRRTAGRS